MNKSDIVNVIASETGLTKTSTLTAVNAIMDNIKKEVQKGGFVALSNFGRFCTSKRIERKGTHPKTGVAITIPEKMVVKFKPGKKFKQITNGEIE